MKLWAIFGFDKETHQKIETVVRADSFDEALKIARRIDWQFSGGQLIEQEDEK